jgi:hypothetical protein
MTPVVVSGIPPYAFNCSGLPSGATCSFSGNQSEFPSTSEIDVSVSLASGIAGGSYPFTVNATSQSHSVAAALTLQVLSYSVQGPPAGSSWSFPGTSPAVPITVQGSSNWNGSGLVNITCSLDFAATCTGGKLTPGNLTPAQLNLAIDVPTGTPVGTHQLTVKSSFSGTTQVYTFPFYVVSFGGSLSTSSLTLARGASGTLNATLTSSAGFTDAVTLQCTAPSEIACSFSPQTPQVTGGTPQSVTVTITAGSTAELQRELPLLRARNLVALAALFPILIHGRRRRWSASLTALAALAISFSLIACGGGGAAGGSGGGSGGGGSNTYTVTITATPVNTSVTSTLGSVTVIVTH